jgi:peptidyl-prolyl cis-trans isomerase SDCCAG10
MLTPAGSRHAFVGCTPLTGPPPCHHSQSTVYNLEPPTKGKVILKTSLGDLEIELWTKEAPKVGAGAGAHASKSAHASRQDPPCLSCMQACRNFVQMCLDGYYDNTIFHRIIKDYLVQGGDPSGTGEGSESIYGGLFKDEFHTRLKFSHRQASTHECMQACDEGIATWE